MSDASAAPPKARMTPPVLPAVFPVAAPPPRWAVVGVWAAVLGAAGLVLFVNPSESRWFPRCVFHELTGLNCPGCGATRALHHLVHGRLLTAARYNALFVLALPFLAYSLASVTREAFTGRGLPMPFLRARWIHALAVVVLLFAVLRNIPVVPFVFLSPP